MPISTAFSRTLELKDSHVEKKASTSASCGRGRGQAVWKGRGLGHATRMGKCNRGRIKQRVSDRRCIPRSAAQRSNAATHHGYEDEEQVQTHHRHVRAGHERPRVLDLYQRAAHAAAQAVDDALPRLRVRAGGHAHQEAVLGQRQDVITGAEGSHLARAGHRRHAAHSQRHVWQRQRP